MRLILCFILLFFSCKKEMSLIKVISTISKGGGSVGSTPATRLIVFTGESNSGGIAPNASATGTELSSRSVVQIWNNTTGGFENLDIGTNNLLGHTGLTGSYDNTHSWELELANLAAAGTIPNPTYLVKTGQGGSVLTDWGTGGSYYTTLKSRVDAAKAVLGSVNIIFFYTHGINDRIAGTATGTFKTRVQTHIANLKADYPGAKFVMVKNMTDNGNDLYNTVIQEIDDADADFSSVSSSGAGVQGDGNHWTYSGQKQICDSFVTQMLSNGW